jgi:hypothetical protein
VDLNWTVLVPFGPDLDLALAVKRKISFASWAPEQHQPTVSFCSLGHFGPVSLASPRESLLAAQTRRTVRRPRQAVEKGGFDAKREHVKLQGRLIG